jgi:hypothetical protein
MAAGAAKKIAAEAKAMFLNPNIVRVDERVGLSSSDDQKRDEARQRNEMRMRMATRYINSKDNTTIRRYLSLYICGLCQDLHTDELVFGGFQKDRPLHAVTTHRNDGLDRASGTTYVCPVSGQRR